MKAIVILLALLPSATAAAQSGAAGAGGALPDLSALSREVDRIARFVGAERIAFADGYLKTP